MLNMFENVMFAIYAIHIVISHHSENRHGLFIFISFTCYITWNESQIVMKLFKTKQRNGTKWHDPTEMQCIFFHEFVESMLWLYLQPVDVWKLLKEMISERLSQKFAITVCLFHYLYRIERLLCARRLA